jgi:hypothetical protein
MNTEKKLPVNAFISDSDSSIATTPVKGSGVILSGTIAVGGFSQLFAAAKPSRDFLTIQNQSAADLWVQDVNGAATMDNQSYKIPAGYTYEWPNAPLGAVYVIGASTGQTFWGKEI